jgi:hypothetical protein
LSLARRALPYMVAAVRTYGAAVLSANTAADSACGPGRELFLHVFGTRAAGEQLPDSLAHLISDPGNEEAQVALEDEVEYALDEDQRLAAAVTETLVNFYRAEAAAGKTALMVDLGDLLRERGDYPGAKIV